MEIIKDDAFRRLLKKGLSGGFLFFGEEDYLKQHALNSACKALCPEEAFSFFNDMRIDPINFTASALLDALTPLPMMADKKIVSVNGLNISAMKPSDIDALCEALEALAEYDFNVLIISVCAGGIDEGYYNKPSKIITRLSKYLTPVKFEAVTTARLTAWAQKHFEHNGINCPDEVCHAIFERAGTSMFTLSAEIDKLSFYLLQNNRSKVTPEDVKNIICATIEEDAFALSNAILDGNSELALSALSVMKYNRVEPLFVLSEISTVISDLILVKAMLMEGKTAFEILPAINATKKTKISEYKLKMYISKSSSKSIDKLKRALSLCSQADAALKLYPQGYGAIEKLLCEI